MTYNYVTVSMTYQSSGGIAASGRVEWWPTAPIVDTTHHLTLAEAVPTILLDVNGTFSVKLLATDNVGLSVFGWAFRPDILGVSNEIQLMTVPFLTLGSTAFLDQLGVYTP